VVNDSTRGIQVSPHPFVLSLLDPLTLISIVIRNREGSKKETVRKDED